MSSSRIPFVIKVSVAGLLPDRSWFAFRHGLLRRLWPPALVERELLLTMMDSAAAAHLLALILERTARVGILGLGYVGLPLAIELARAGFKTTGIDIDPGRVASINAGSSYIADVLASDVARLQRSGALQATTDFGVIAELDTINICVPTPFRKTKEPDLSTVIGATEQIAKHLHPGMLIVLESTTYPGTTEEIVLSMLEGTGLRVGRDFFLAFSPERIEAGNPLYNTRNIPKVVGGVTRDCTRLASALYGAAIESVVSVSSPRVAEMVKLLENGFRAVNIGLVNELAMMCQSMNIDVWEVINAARTKPFGFMPFYPGPGVGGYSIPVDTFYLSWKAKQTGFEPRFIELAADVNAAMPHLIVELIADALNGHGKAVRGSSVLVAGVAYKRDVDDIRESPALDVMTQLAAKGANVAYSDPHVPTLPAAAWGGGVELKSVPLTPFAIREADCVTILTDHVVFDADEIVAHANLVVDTRNATGGRMPQVFRLGAPRPREVAAPTAPIE
jgi:UDP-N-acetyl-D-glucosamine dehydrogenase